jgi:multidrug resistance efflux pump
MKSLSLRILLALLVVAGFVAIVFAFSGPTTAAPIPPSRPIASQIAAPPQNAGSMTNATATGVRAIGTMASANQASLAFQMAGRVKTINVKEGDAVHAGDVLVSLDTTMLDLQVVQAQAALDTAQARLDQLKNPSSFDVAAAQAQVAAVQAALLQLKTPTVNDLLIAKADVDNAQAALNQAQAAYDRAGGASNPYIGMLPQALALQQASNAFLKAQAAYNARTSPSDAQLKQAQALVEQAQAQLNRLTNPSPNDVKSVQAAVAQAQAALDLAKQNIANAKIVAPFDGTVVWLGPHLAESAAPNAPMVTLADLSRMQVQIGVDENTLAQLKPGQTAIIAADALPGKTFTGHISRIGLQATTTAGIISLPVTIDVDGTDAPITPGLSTAVEINTGK